MGTDAAAVMRPVLLDNTVLTNFALVSKADLVMHLGVLLKAWSLVGASYSEMNQ